MIHESLQEWIYPIHTLFDLYKRQSSILGLLRWQYKNVIIYQDRIRTIKKIIGGAYDLLSENEATRT